jgi:hypothetical protein
VQLKRTCKHIISAHTRPYILFLLVLLVISSSCNPTKYVPEQESLLEENHIKISRDGIKKSDLLPYIKQKPNKRFFGARFHLGLFNLSNIKKEKWPHSWLRRIGEEPVIFDQYAAGKSREQLESYISSKGFFDSRVRDSVATVKRRSEVFYMISIFAHPIQYETFTMNLPIRTYKNCFILIRSTA